MSHLIRRLRGALIAFAALALSAGLAFGAQPPENWGLTNASEHAGKTVPVRAGQLGEDVEDTDEDVNEDTDEDVNEDVDDDEDTAEDVDTEGAEDGDNCSTNPTGLSDAEIAEIKHGSLVCWAAHQDEELLAEGLFANHGQWVKSWARWGKDDEETTDDDVSDEDISDEDAGALSAGKGHGKGQGKGKGHNK